MENNDMPTTSAGDDQPVPILGITVTGDVLLPAGLRQVEILALLQRLNTAIKQRLDNQIIQ